MATISGTNGVDIITVSNDSNNTINTGNGEDKVTITGDGDNTVNLGNGNDTLIIQGDGNTVVDAGNGTDIIQGGSGDETVYAGNGDDVVYFSQGQDFVDGGLGVDTIIFSGVRSNYRITIMPTSDPLYPSGYTTPVYKVTDLQSGQSYTVFTRVETLKFADVTLSPAQAITNNPPIEISINNDNINENTTGQVGVLSANDVGIKFSVVGGSTLFTIVDGNKLFLNTAQNFENLSTLSVTVRGTDANGLYFDKVLTIKINDVNEAPTAQDDIVGQTVSEDGAAFALDVLANDQDVDANDNKTLELLKDVTVSIPGYTLTKTLADIAEIQGNTVVIKPNAFNELRADQSGEIEITYVMRDAQGLTSEAKIKFMVQGANDGAVITGDSTGNVVEDGITTASGALVVSDVDMGQAKFQIPSSLIGTYGNFAFNADTGAWTYTLRNNDANVQALTKNSIVTDKLVVTSLDGTATQEIVVTIQGADDNLPPTLTVTNQHVVGIGENGTGNTLIADLLATDPNVGDAVSYVIQPNSPFADKFETVFNTVRSTWELRLKAGASFDYDSADLINKKAYVDLVAVDSSGADNNTSASQRVWIDVISNNPLVMKTTNVINGGLIANPNFLDFNGDGNLDSLSYQVVNSPQGPLSRVVLSLEESSDSIIFSGFLINEFGSTYSNAGDLNGDGFDDVIIGSPLSNGKYGAFYVVFGSTSPGFAILEPLSESAFPVVSIKGTQDLKNLGYSVAGAGDINGDGFDDIIVSAPQIENFNKSTVYIFYGSSSFTSFYSGPINIDEAFTSNSGFKITGPFSPFVPLTVAGAGDVNGDGYDDFIVRTSLSSNFVESYVIYGSMVNEDVNLLSLGSRGFKISTPGMNAYAFAAGDQNNDGRDDLLVSNQSQPNLDGSRYILYFEAQQTFNNILRGGDTNSILEGSSGKDLLEGRAGNDTLLGGAGDDTLMGGTGADILQGGDGFDTADYGLSSAAVNIILTGPGTGTGLGGDAEGDQLFSIEKVIGSTFDDEMTGSQGNDWFYGGVGDDRLFSGSGNDTLYGGAGNDILDGGDGTDYLEGGTGNDTYYINNMTSDIDSIIEFFNEGIDKVMSIGGFTLPDNVENLLLLSGGEGIGNSLNNEILGSIFSDIIKGNAGNDTLSGGLGNDVFLYDLGLYNEHDIIQDFLRQDTIIMSNAEVGSSPNITFSNNEAHISFSLNNFVTTITLQNIAANSLFTIETNPYEGESSYFIKLG